MIATFGEYIRHLRTNKGLTLTELAALLKLDSANLCKIENGKREFDEKRLDKLAKAFNLNFEELKTEYFGDQFAKKLHRYNCSSDALLIAQEKVNYLRNIDAK
ncbi:helix-turn-helix domain-containing protein [Sphingobacterium siyangense]|uniref:helix-turn-helix domain-containing protein n=1 Tax=Sphingobacterium TaxID=28453 RepID=UPI003DA4CB30